MPYTGDRLNDILSRDGAAKDLWHHSAVGMAFVDKSGCFVAVNPRLCSLLGYAPTELHGKHFAAVTQREDVDPDEDLFRKLMAGEISEYSMVQTYTTKYGKRVVAKLNVHRFDDEAEVVWSQVQAIDTLSLDTLSDEDQERVAAQLMGRLLWQHKRQAILAILAIAGLTNMDRFISILTG